ncbi:MAG: efflux RND transporter periplasmic adaptor subunit [Candidatus Omnitrophota bacterium]|nr:efflux RND transporter periplasmic adaptor subunit [Candidatus Omnitrophota bacterium]
MKKLLFICFILVLFMVGCQERPFTKREDSDIVPVKAVQVRLQDIYEILEYVGNIKAKDEVVVFPKVSGKIIEKIKQDGASVVKGEAIAYIDRDEVGLKFEKAPVESPLTGIVGRIYVDIGSHVLPDTAVALVVNMDKVKINLDIPEKFLPLISLDKEAKIKVDAYIEQEFSGEVTKISPVVDLATRSAPVEIVVDNPDHLLKSGMFAKVKLIVQRHKDVPVILKEAIIGKAPDTYVYVIKDNKAILKKVSLGIHQGPYFEVKEGLKEEELVVIVGQQRLKDNAKVTVELEEENKNHIRE